MSRRSAFCSHGFCCRHSSQATEHSSGHETGAARVIEIEDPSNHFTRCEQAWNRDVIDIKDLPGRINLHAAECKGDTARNRPSLEWGRIKRASPIGFRHWQSARGTAILLSRVERNFIRN